MEREPPGPRRLSLRFASGRMEASYVASRRPVLISRLKWALSLLLAGSGVLLLMVLAAWPAEQTELEREILAVRLAGISVLGAMAALVLLALCCPLSGRVALQSHVILEVAVIALITIGMFLPLVTTPTRFVKIRGRDLEDALGTDYDSDSSLLLVIDGMITLTHLGLPIRWFVMAPLEAIAMLCYALNVAYIGTEESRENVFMNLLLLGLLVAASALGKRSAELDERRSFLKMISEKALRCEAEFQLSQVSRHAVADRPSESEDSSNRPSEPVTDRSGAVFEALFEGNPESRAAQLARVAARGEVEHWRIGADKVRPLREEAIGSGGFGSVQRAIFCGMLVVVKSPHVEALRVPDLCNELRVLRHLRHPHIVTTHGAVVLPEQQQVFLVLELIEGVDLTGFLLPRAAEESPTVFARYQVMLGVCRALLYMHTLSPQIVHGDLKGSNIMVECAAGCRDSAFPKLVDFGLSRVVGRHSRALGGTRTWMAPEVYCTEHGPVRCSADVYSLGHVLSFTATSRPPARRRSLLRRRPPEPAWPDGCAFADCKPLVQACLQWKQELRPHVGHVHELLLGLAGKLDLSCPQVAYLQSVRLLHESMEARRASYLKQLQVVAEATEADRSWDLQQLWSSLKPSRLTSLPEEAPAQPEAQGGAQAFQEGEIDSSESSERRPGGACIRHL